jgi:hypothetical protein
MSTKREFLLKKAKDPMRRSDSPIYLVSMQNVQVPRQGPGCQRSLLAIERAQLEAVCAAEEMTKLQKVGVLH